MFSGEYWMDNNSVFPWAHRLRYALRTCAVTFCRAGSWWKLALQQKFFIVRRFKVVDFLKSILLDCCG